MKDALDLKKAEWEIRKLQAETYGLTRGWWRGTLPTAVVTALVTLAIGMGGILYNAHKDREAVLQTADASLADRFYRARDNLSSPSANVRENAVRDVGAFASGPNPPSGIGPSLARRAVIALQDQLIIEDEREVLRLLASTLGDAGAAALPGTIDVNRRAGHEYARYFGELARAVGADRNADLNGRHAPDELTNADGTIDEAVSSITGERASATTTAFSQFNLWNVPALFDSYSQGYDFHLPAQNDKQRGLLASQAAHNARVLAASARAIENMLHSSREHFEAVDLHSTILYGIDLSNVDMSEANLAKSVIIGDGSHFTCDKCNVKDAYLYGFALADASMRDADVTGVYFGSLGSIPRDGPPRVAVNLKGANWWNACEAVGSAYARPKWLEKVYRETPTYPAQGCFTSPVTAPVKPPARPHMKQRPTPKP